jgi:hypothetical protein
MVFPVVVLDFDEFSEGVLHCHFLVIVVHFGTTMTQSQKML